MQLVKPASNMIFGTVEKSGPASKSGLYVPETAQKKIALSKILAVGSEVADYKPGQVIIYKDYTQHDLKLDDGEFILLEVTDILGELIVEEGKSDVSVQK